MLRVGQVMNRNVRTCSGSETLNAAARIMWEEDCGCVPVVEYEEDGARRLVGMITDRDVCMAAYIDGRSLSQIPVSVAMAKDVASCLASDSLHVALNVLRSRRVRRLPVLEGEAHLVGLLSLADISREGGHARKEQRYADLPPEELAITLEVLSEPRHGTNSVVQLRS
jgi:CBS domain-containing protein